VSLTAYPLIILAGHPGSLLLNAYLTMTVELANCPEKNKKSIYLTSKTALYAQESIKLLSKANISLAF